MMEIKLGKDPNVIYAITLRSWRIRLLHFLRHPKVGAILGGGTEDEIHSMAAFGHLLGIAYQIHDDLVDWNDEDRLFNGTGKEK